MCRECPLLPDKVLASLLVHESLCIYFCLKRIMFTSQFPGGPFLRVPGSVFVSK